MSNNPAQPFPDIESAAGEPNGLLAVGGDLSPGRLLNAYQNGIFPWFNDDQPILWWSPNPRAVLFPAEFHVSRSLHRTLNQQRFTLSTDQAFKRVMQACALPRVGQQGTWISAQMVDAYVRLHELGMAHSVECWCGDELAGGIYGVSIGRVFFGESMFSHRTDASKVAMHSVARMGYGLIDCQVENDHLMSLGARQMPRQEFATYLDTLCAESGPVWATTHHR